MAITRSYNRHNNTYYAYETEYVYDETKQKKVPKRHCVGKFDSNGNVIPNGKRGRRSTPLPVTVQEEALDATQQASAQESLRMAESLSYKQQTIDNVVSTTTSLVTELETDISTLKTVMGELHSSLAKMEGELSTISAMLNDLTDTPLP